MRPGLINKYLEDVSVENFENAVISDDVIVDDSVNEWIQQEDLSLDSQREALTTVDQLDTLANQVENSDPGVSIEHYRWVFKTITGNAQLEPNSKISLEAFGDKKIGKNELATLIRKHSKQINNAVTFSLEDYVNSFAKNISSLVDDYNKSSAGLKHIENKVQPADKTVVINHKSIWELFHKNGELVKDPIKAINEDISTINDLTTTIEGVADELKSIVSANKPKENSSERATLTLDSGDLLNITKDYLLLNNIELTVSPKGAVKTVLDLKKPGKYWKVGDLAWPLVWGFIAGGILGILLGPLWGSAAALGPLTTIQKTGNQAEKKQSSTEMRLFVKNVLNLEKNVDRIDTAIYNISKVIDMESEDNKRVIKKAISPTLELASVILQHINEITYGAEILFRKIDKK